MRAWWRPVSRGAGVRTGPVVRGALLAGWLATALVLAGARPAAALLPPQPQLQWRAGFLWGLNEQVHGLDWGAGVKLPLQPSELGIATLGASIQGALTSGPAEWDFRLSALIESYRTGRPSFGVYYTLRRFPFLDGTLAGIGLRYGSLAAAYYPAMWNREVPALAPDRAVWVVEPGWFSGLYLQFRYAALSDGGPSSLRLAAGLEENW